MLTSRLQQRTHDSRLFKRYIQAGDRYLTWVFLPLFIGSMVVMLIGTSTGSIPFKSQGFEIVSALLFLAIASWFAVNGLGLAWRVAIDLVDDASRERLADVACSAFLALVAGVFVFGAYVFIRAAAAARARAA